MILPPDWPRRPHGGFRTFYADPPWKYEAWSAAGEQKNPSQHYPCMSFEELAAWATPVKSLAARNSAMFMWATFPKLPEALALLEAWGFEYKTGGAWGKQSSTGNALAFGTGYVFRSAAELLLVGTTGDPTWTSKSIRNLWLAPVREHSRKPDCVLQDIERLAIGPRLEMFTRQVRPGWTAMGNQTDRFEALVDEPLTETPAGSALTRSPDTEEVLAARGDFADLNPGLVASVQEDVTTP